MNAIYQFLPWVRSGVAGAVTTAETLPAPQVATLDARAKLSVKVQVNSGPEATASVRLFGPGEVIGFDHRVVVRTDPPHLSGGFEPNYFPVVEFDWPELPWLFTPARANTNGQLRPWICLIAVRKRDGVRITSASPLPVLEISGNAKEELPPLGEAWAWAHAQVAGKPATGQTLAEVMAQSPERVISRLVCARRLRPNTAYYACVVPTFAVGRKAGLGEPVPDSEKLEPAWPDPGDAAWAGIAKPFRLPVYYSWEFGTGADGDFESLVRLLEPREDLENVGTRPLAAPNPGAGLPVPASLPPLEGALRVRKAVSPPLTAVPSTFRTALQTAINQPEKLTSTTVAEPVAPPMYGRWHAAQRELRTTATTTAPISPLWLRELNLDPRWRAAAGFGARIVQDQQEHLVASAWEQVGEVERANELLRQAQLARSVDTAVYDGCLTTLHAASLVQLTGPAHTRVLGTAAAASDTISRQIRGSVFPAAAVSPQFRRATRPGGPLARRVGGGGAQQNVNLISGLALGSIRAAAPRSRPAGTVAVGDAKDAGDRNRQLDVERLKQLKEILASMPANAPEAAFGRAALPQLASTLGLVRNSDREGGPSRPRFDLNGIRLALLLGLDPEKTVARRVLHRITIPGGRWSPEDPLEPVMAAPEFPTPMYRSLAEISQDLLLPGLEHVAPNTIALLESNARFIEAFMVGLNHEMGRELLWREYPTDQRGTYFRQFWDPSGIVPAPTDPESVKDIPPIVANLPVKGWDPAAALGASMKGAGGGNRVVLMFRGELLRRYPGALIYAVKGEWARSGATDIKPRSPIAQPTAAQRQYPVFHGTLTPDVTFLGFDLDAEEVLGNDEPADGPPGWFFVIEQPPTDARFGLDESAPGTVSGWRDLAWPHVQTTNDVQAGGGAVTKGDGYVRVGASLQSFTPLPTTPTRVSWGTSSNSAALAYVILQLPFRIAIHASDLLPTFT